MKNLLKKLFYAVVKNYLFKSQSKYKYVKPKKKKGLKYLIAKRFFD